MSATIAFQEVRTVLPELAKEVQTVPLKQEGLEIASEFTELLSTPIEDARAREAVQRLADEQAALRRMATLVAEGASARVRAIDNEGRKS